MCQGSSLSLSTIAAQNQSSQVIGHMRLGAVHFKVLCFLEMDSETQDPGIGVVMRTTAVTVDSLFVVNRAHSAMWRS